MQPVALQKDKIILSPSDIGYLSEVVFTTGIVEADDHYIIASGEDNLCCRITHINKKDIF